jgi:enoyl-CoA hydratase/carnithine racemase
MSNIAVETKGAVRIIRLDRPEKKNALTVAMYEDLIRAFDDAKGDDAVRALLVVGHPGVFSAGNDIPDFIQNPPTGEDSAVFRVLTAISTFPKPVVAGVDGPAVGLGTTMLLHFDLVVASTTAKFRMPFVPLGLVPEGASSVLAPLFFGIHRASEWLLLGDVFSAEEAHRAGLINRLVESSEVEPTALGLAEALASRPPEAVRLAKKLLREPLATAVAEAISREGKLFIERLRSPEALEALTAFASRGKK